MVIGNSSANMLLLLVFNKNSILYTMNLNKNDLNRSRRKIVYHVNGLHVLFDVTKLFLVINKCVTSVVLSVMNVEFLLL